MKQELINELKKVFSLNKEDNLMLLAKESKVKAICVFRPDLITDSGHI